MLDETGRSTWAWAQAFTVVINAYDGSITYTPQFFLMKHLSAFVKPGSCFLKPTVEVDAVLAYKLPDGSVAVVVCNSSRLARAMEFHIGDQAAQMTLAAHFFNIHLSLSNPPRSVYWPTDLLDTEDLECSVMQLSLTRRQS